MSTARNLVVSLDETREGLQLWRERALFWLCWACLAAMAVANLIIDSDFKWPMLSLAVVLSAALFGRSLGAQPMSLLD